MHVHTHSCIHRHILICHRNCIWIQPAPCSTHLLFAFMITQGPNEWVLDWLWNEIGWDERLTSLFLLINTEELSKGKDQHLIPPQFSLSKLTVFLLVKVSLSLLILQDVLYLAAAMEESISEKWELLSSTNLHSLRLLKIQLTFTTFSRITYSHEIVHVARESLHLKT